jgi:hypothetical protein
MTANDAISKIRVLLGVEEEPKQEVAMASATLVDGTQVEVEGDFEVGKPVFVVTEEGNIPAPAGVHQTTDNLLVTVDESGVIAQIEEVAPEAQQEEKKEEAMEEDNKEEVAMEEHDDKKEEMEDEIEEEMEDEDEMIVKIVEAMKPYFEEIKDLKEKVVEMEGKFQNFSKEPAAKPIKKAEAFEANRLTAVERIAKIRKSK